MNVTEERTQRRDDFVGVLHTILSDALTPSVVTRSGNWLKVVYEGTAFNIVVSAKRGGDQ